MPRVTTFAGTFVAVGLASLLGPFFWRDYNFIFELWSWRTASQCNWLDCIWWSPSNDERGNA